MNPSVRGVAWLDTDAAAAHLGLTKRAFYHFVAEERARVPRRLRIYRLKGQLRFRQADLDKCVEEEPAATVPLKLVGGSR